MESSLRKLTRPELRARKRTENLGLDSEMTYGVVWSYASTFKGLVDAYVCGSGD